jgi:polyphosphate kinase
MRLASRDKKVDVFVELGARIDECKSNEYVESWVRIRCE